MKTSRIATLGLVLAAAGAFASQNPAPTKPPAAPAAAKAVTAPSPAAKAPAQAAGAALPAPAAAKTGAPAAGSAKTTAPAPAPAKPVAPAPATKGPAPAKSAGPTPVAPAAVPQPAAPEPEGRPTGGALVQSILEEDLEPPRNGFIYNPAGRRDPFISLAKPVQAEENANRPRRPGIEGFMLQETALRGLVKTPDAWIAVLEGPDRKAYFVRTGQRMHDGVVTGIDAAGLSFRQEITDPLSPAKSREVRRLLHSVQEESNK